MNEKPQPQAAGGVFYGWWILLLGAIINGIGSGITYHGFTVFFLPLKRDLAVSSAAISLLYGAARLEGGLEGPLVGYLIDRFGFRKLILAGATLTGLGLILLSQVESFTAFFIVYVFLVALGSNAGFFHPVSTGVNKWFIRHRGFGFAVITASGSIGGMIMAPLLSYIILSYGWRNGLIFAGVVILAVAIPAALPLKGAPEEIGLRPDGDRPAAPLPAAGPAAAAEARPEGHSVRDALGTPQFWLLATCISLRLMVTVALNTHFVPLLVWKGMSETASAFMVSLYALLSIPIAVGLGWTGDRWNKARLSGLCVLPAILSMVGLIVLEGQAILYFFPVAFALIMGTAPLNWALIGDFFGRSSYATLRGIMGVGYGLATFVSPIYAGWVFDRTQSYTPVLVSFSVILAFTAVSFLALKPPAAAKTGR